jgi:hypothetical protein
MFFFDISQTWQYLCLNLPFHYSTQSYLGSMEHVHYDDSYIQFANSMTVATAVLEQRKAETYSCPLELETGQSACRRAEPGLPTIDN